MTGKLTPILGPLTATAVGDSFGCAYEYSSEHYPPVIERGYMKHPTHGLLAGQYSDDTQMSCAIAEALLEDDPWEPLTLTRRFFDVFKRDPRPGYAASFYEFLKRVESPEQFLDEIRPDSSKSGGAMRAPLIGLLPDTSDVMMRAVSQASITHNTAIGKTGALVAALTFHYLHYLIGPKEGLGKWLDKMVRVPAEIMDDATGRGVRFEIKEAAVMEVPYSWNWRWISKVKAPGYHAPHAAVSAVMENKTLSGVLKACVDYTGDVDTCAAIAMSAASRSVEIENDLPAILFETLEAGPYGIEYLRSLDERLLNKYPSPRK